MSKLNRILWSGLVLVGAACGDDVTVTPPPEPPPPGIREVTVGPDGGSVAVGGTLQMIASVTLDPGATGAPTIAWSSSDNGKATVGATTGLVTGVAVGSVGIRATATLGTSTGQGVATVNVVGTTGCVINGVTISPDQASLTVGETLQLAPSVDGTNCVEADLGVSYTSGNTAIATVSATGVVTAVGAGTTTIVIKSAKDATKQAAMSIEVTVPDPATISIQSITQGGLGTPVNLNNVAGQIEVALNVDRGGKELDRVDALIGGIVVASQNFAQASAPVAAGPAATVPVTVILNVNTMQLKQGLNGLYIPVVFNGQKAITANLYVVGATTPISSNAVPVLMNNEDQAIAPGDGVGTGLTDETGGELLEPFTDGGGRVWQTGNFFAEFNYLAFSNRTPATSLVLLNAFSPLCGINQQTSTATGTPTEGILFNNSWNCRGTTPFNGFQGSRTVDDDNGATTWAVGTTGPDGSALNGPDEWSALTSEFCISNVTPCPAGDVRWNLITPTPNALSGPYWVDNVAPTPSGIVAYNPNFDQLWISGTFDWAAAITGTAEAAGVGSGYNAASDAAYLYDGTLTAPPGPVPTCATGSPTVLANAHGLAQTLTDQGADSYRACLETVDNVGNSGRLLSNNYGVDTENPTGRLYLSTGVDPFGGYLTPNVSSVANTSEYSNLAAIINMPWTIEGQDGRSGFNQIDANPGLPVNYYANSQTLTRVSPVSTVDAGDAACVLADDMLTTLSDAWKRSAFPVAGQDQLDCGAGVGYYFYNGYVIDRAGNQSAPIVRNFVYDLAAPNMTGIGFQTTPYAQGQPGAFSFSANDDLNIIEAQLGFNYNGLIAPAVGILFPYQSAAVQEGAGFGIVWPTLKSQLAFVLNAATVSAPVIFRIDQVCVFDANPYPSCDVTQWGTGSRPELNEYNTNLNGGGLLTDVQKLPQFVLANVRDQVDHESLTGAVGALLNTQFTPSTGIPAPWGVAGDIPPIGLDIANWTIAAVGNNIVATHRTRSSNGLSVFTSVHLMRFNAVTNVWTHCAVYVNPTAPTIDNGSFRTWTYTVTNPETLPVANNACHSGNGVGGQFQVMGVVNGAALGTPLL
jgi:hypothetical protein